MLILLDRITLSYETYLLYPEYMTFSKTFKNEEHNNVVM
jgi:hypothetical protein